MSEELVVLLHLENALYRRDDTIPIFLTSRGLKGAIEIPKNQVRIVEAVKITLEGQPRCSAADPADSHRLSERCYHTERIPIVQLSGIIEAETCSYQYLESRIFD